MSEAAIPSRPPVWPMLVTLGLVAMLSGGLLVIAYHATLPAIQERHRQVLELGAAAVLPGAATRAGFDLTEDGLAPLAPGEPRGTPVFAGYDASGRLTALALQGAARGYQDLVRVIFAYDPGCACVTGFAVLESKETPGFGDRAMTDAEFLANFQALDARLDASGTALANPIRTVKHGRKRHPWEIDAISGATITSRAVGKAIHDAAAAQLPRLAPHLDRLGRLP